MLLGLTDFGLKRAKAVESKTVSDIGMHIACLGLIVLGL